MGLLAITGLAPQLAGELGDLAGSGGAQWVAHGQQPAGGTHRAGAADVEVSLLQPRTRFPWPAVPHGLQVQQLLDGEGVVELNHIKVSGPDSRFRESLGGGLRGESGVDGGTRWVGRLAAGD